MSEITIRKTLIAAALLVALAGCAQEPYIYQSSEFDRSRADFATQLTDRTELQICYAKQSTTPQDLLAMANAECARFGKEAVFEAQDLLICPVMTPARAKFRCVAR